MGNREGGKQKREGRDVREEFGREGRSKRGLGERWARETATDSEQTGDAGLFLGGAEGHGTAGASGHRC
jgi:hypothetical protein